VAENDSKSTPVLDGAPLDTTVAAGPGDPASEAEVLPHGTVSDRLDVQRWLPAVLVAVVAMYSLLSSGVTVPELVRFALYWVICLFVPGTLVMRALLGPRHRPLEALALGAVTGLALEATVSAVFGKLGADQVVRWWWIAPYVLFAAVPALRRHWRGTPAARLTPAVAWALAAVSGLAIVTGWQFFRTTALSPAPSAPYIDHWFHLSIINELMRPGPHVVPQVASETLTYHALSHAHVANASVIGRLDPELAFSRLWILPILVLTVLLLQVLAGVVTEKQWAGPVACWLAFTGLAGSYIWVDRGATLGSPFVTLSPSQLFANPIMIAGAIWLVTMIRTVTTRGWPAWLLIISIAGVGAKPTVLPALLGGTALAIAAAWWIDRRAPRRLLMALGTMLAVQLVWTAINTAPAGKLTILGSVASLGLYRELTGVVGLRANNDGLLLDSLDGRRAWFAAGASVLWLAAVQATRLVGIATIFRRSTRTDPVAWWMTGALVAGWGVFFVSDQSGFGQSYFVFTVVPIGAVLTVWLLASLLDEVPAKLRRRSVMAGLAAGAAITIIVRGLVSGRSSAPSYGSLESALLPVVIVAVIATVSALAWRRWAGEFRIARIGGVLVVAAVIGMTLPTALDEVARSIGRLSTPVSVADAESPGFVPAAEQDAMRWLRDNTPEGDVVATNVHCRPADSTAVYCDARSFMVSGLGGRRTVLEGWAYTAEAHALHGVGGRGHQFQPSPFPEQYELSQAALEEPTEEILDTLADDYHARWLVGVRRAGPVSPVLDDLAENVFDNGDVVIYRLNR
jgi:hypothetical protein